MVLSEPGERFAMNARALRDRAKRLAAEALRRRKCGR
jgi:hypothetical protein